MVTRDRPRGEVEIYAMAQMRIKQFEMLDLTKRQPHGYPAYLLAQHFRHVEYLIDLNVA